LKIKHTFSLFVLIITPVVSAAFDLSLGSSHSQRDYEIDGKLRAHIRKLNDDLLRNIALGNSDSITSMLSEQTKTLLGTNAPTFINQLKSTTTPNYKIKLQYYTKSSAEGMMVVLPSGQTEADAYSLQMKLMNKESYITILEFNSASNSRYSLLVVYGKYSENWKINIVHVGETHIYNASGPAYFGICKEQFEAGHIEGATIMCSVASELMWPFKDFLQYKSASEYSSFMKKLEVKNGQLFTFPLRVNSNKMPIEILDISPHFMEEGIFPQVSYLSKINFKDTTSLRKEFVAAKTYIDSIYNFGPSFKSILYRAYSKMPDGNSPVETFGFVDEKNAPND